MGEQLSITLAQLSPIVGDISGNAAKLLDAWSKAESDLIVFPELFLCGYPPEDLVLKPAFCDAIAKEVERLIEASKDFEPAALLSYPKATAEGIYNHLILVHKGEVLHAQDKHILPNYGVFDEQRIFESGPLPDIAEFKGHKLGILICEDLWDETVPSHLSNQGAEIFISLNASPFETGKTQTRYDVARENLKGLNTPLIYVNQIGGQDELVFDGASFVMDAGGETVFQMPSFEEAIADIEIKASQISTPVSTASLSEYEHVYKALCLGLRDYVEKNGFPGILLGLSGGVDSSLAATIAVDALGADKVQCVMMPSRFTSQDSLEDAKALAERLGTSYEIIEIEKAMDAFEDTIPDLSGTAHENMQSRIRGLILMALSNSNGKMLLSTGNKSEMAVGYATLYGDMNGGFNVLKDVYKMQVYALCEWRNTQGAVIPERILTKAPSAELRDNQTDQDSLPEYEALDDILAGLIEEELNIQGIAARGHDEDTIKRVWQMLDRTEYKRRQAPPGVKITSRAFGRERRYPITNKFGA